MNLLLLVAIVVLLVMVLPLKWTLLALLIVAALVLVGR